MGANNTRLTSENNSLFLTPEPNTRLTSENNSLLTPDPHKREKSILNKQKQAELLRLAQKPPKDDKFAVINDVIKQYNDGVTRGSTYTNFRDGDAHYCDKLKEIFGDKLDFCGPGNFKNPKEEQIYFKFK